jgi:hypothetical protein
MTLFIPKDFVPLPIAMVYAVGKALQRETSNDAGKEPKRVQLFSHSDAERGQAVYSLYRVDHVDLKAHEHNKSDYTGALVCLAPLEGLGDGNCTITLYPPFTSCLSESATGRMALFPVDPYMVADNIRQYLSNNTLPASVCESSTGHITKLPQEFWRTDMGEFAIHQKGRITVQLENKSTVGHVLIPFKELKAILSPDEAPDDNLPEYPTYIPPYLGLMLKAVTELNLSQDERVAKKTIEQWLYDNWNPDELLRPSTNKIQGMATLLRDPKDQKGGNVKLKIVRDGGKKKPPSN